MARVVSLTLFILSWLLLFSYATSRARNEDIPSINCQVCEKVTHQIHQQVQSKEAHKSLKKVSELEIIENICDHMKQEDHWIWQIDIVEKRAQLELEEKGVEGQCNSVCKTIEQACQEVIKKFADKEIAQFKNRPSIDELANGLCHELFPDACPKDIIEREKPSKDAKIGNLLYQVMRGHPTLKKYRPFAAATKAFKKIGKIYRTAMSKEGKKVRNSKSPKSIKSEL